MVVDVKNPVIEIHDLIVSYNKKPVLWDIDLSLPAKNVIGIVGPNGAGKSTLLKSIMGLVQPVSGYIKIFDRPLDSVRQDVSYVPQKESVDWDFPASALDVVLMGRYSKMGLFKRPSSIDKEIAMNCLRKVGMENFSTRQIAQLSGGQQQRVFIARALAQEAKLYLMDEPFAGVDATTEKIIMDILHELASKGNTVLVVHHDLQSIHEYFQWCILLNMRLLASGPTNLVITDQLLEETYGGRLNLLTRIGRILDENEISPREEPPGL
jgi:manganese/zinc/iron transport system ATP- binding protein